MSDDEGLGCLMLQSMKPRQRYCCVNVWIIEIIYVTIIFSTYTQEELLFQSLDLNIYTRITSVLVSTRCELPSNICYLTMEFLIVNTKVSRNCYKYGRRLRQSNKRTCTCRTHNKETFRINNLDSVN